MGWVQETRNGVDESGLQEEREGVVKEVGRVAANLVFEDGKHRHMLFKFSHLQLNASGCVALPMSTHR